MTFLYEKINTIREFQSLKCTPDYIVNNINKRMQLRPYQNEAFENFIFYFESNLCQKPTQTLFHMATGSGKTMIMAGLILYLYRKGYRNFLFFVNLNTIVQQTKENFLNSSANKYLFANEIIIDGEKINIREVKNFQEQNDDINICFSTIQGLNNNIWETKENDISFEDIEDKKIVLISDEAHHLNVDTLRVNKKAVSNTSWEYTVKRILNANRDNILLEFTATCDIENPIIRAEYENKIVYNYDIKKFRIDKYSKEIKTLRSDFDVMNRALQAIILSQYRYKVFQDYRQNIKPVILFKSKLVKDNNINMKNIIDMVKKLDGEKIRVLFEKSTSDIIKKAEYYFNKSNITYNELAAEIKDDFSEEHCISANDNNFIENKQIILNTLEDKNNPYRAVFAVDKLNEGWDVLNLFDIVRLYETRDSKNGVPGKTTIQEAQLIGRGARYCPFKITNDQEMYKRKYDDDLDNILRICEELYYHCQNEPRYISELHNALRKIGIDLNNNVERQYFIKDEFKEDELYKKGFVFINTRRLKSRDEIVGLLPSVKDKVYDISIATGRSGEDTLLEENSAVEANIENFLYRTTIKDISDTNYSIVLKALAKFPVFKFNILKGYFPRLKSTKEFVCDNNYLGGIKIHITSRYDKPNNEILYLSCIDVLEKVANSISNIKETYEGTREFYAKHIHEVFKNKKCLYTAPHDGGLGVSQNDSSVPVEWKINLANEEWFVYEDNYGTSEEKAFVAYFKSYVNTLKEKYSKVFLVRNERQLAIYSFDGGERFEPDYLLFLCKSNGIGYEQLQIFIEPKGTHLLEKDKWKENFLLDIESKSIPVIKFADDNKYRIWGFHFFNKEEKMQDFEGDMKRITE